MGTNNRLLSLDILRGMTVAGMILVNNAGGPHSYAPLKHAEWNGLTPCDLVFPFFLFIMGVSIYISLSKNGFGYSSSLLFKIIKRSLIILFIGLALNWLLLIAKTGAMSVAELRLTGVLPRIAICYCVVSLLSLMIKERLMPWVSAGILIVYSVLLLTANGYINGDTNIIAIVDKMLLGQSHIYTKRAIDPEGILGTLPSIAHTLIGFSCGAIIKSGLSVEKKMSRLFLTGFLLTAVGLLLAYLLPVNKRIWSPTFVLVTSGIASLILAALTYIIDIKGKERWSFAFMIFGVNPLFLYVFSEVMAIVFSATDIKNLIYDYLLTIVKDPYFSSLIYSLLFVSIMGVAGQILYMKKVFIKI